ncbi:hypothetical protein T484DRAFT_1839924 [Baffinella frigidus]|nr:hypothetical protein T484DRAFT_1839924 [Cryptophyta sp. CCMP2293]
MSLEPGKGELSRSLNSTEVRLVTFGEPRVGNVFFAEFINQRLPLAIRLVHQVASLPRVVVSSQLSWVT